MKPSPLVSHRQVLSSPYRPAWSPHTVRMQSPSRRFPGLPICIRVLLFDCSVLYQPLPSRFLEFFGSAGAIVGEVLCFDLWVVVHIHVVAMEAPANGLAGLGFSASAFAMGPLLPLLRERLVRLGRSRFCVAQLLRG